MPALTIFRKFDTSPFAGDDLHILIAILGVFRLLQFVCLVAASVKFWWAQLNGVYVLVNGYAPWCLNYTPIDFSFSGNIVKEILIFRESNIQPISYRTYGVWLGCAVIYLCVDVAWMCFLWTASSIGTITEPRNRDKFVRRLILGIVRIHIARRDNFDCPEGVDYNNQHLNPWDGNFIHAIFIVLMCTYAIELLMWPLVIVNVIVQQLKKTGRLFIDGRQRLHRRAERLERVLGFVLRIMQCCTCGRFGGQELKNKGELSEFAVNVMHLFNNDTHFNIVLSDMYCGFRMLARVQRERRWRELKLALNEVSSEQELDVINESNGGMCRNHRGSIMILKSLFSDEGGPQLVEREILQESNADDMNAMKETAHYVTYASCVYFRLQNMVIEAMDRKAMSSFQVDDLFNMDFRLSNIGYEHALLCYASFVNGIVSTPYSILVDEETEKIVIAIRGTRSIEDIIIDLLFVPAHLDKVGEICGFEGKGHSCHKGILARSKWLYNDLKKTKVLKTLYSEKSPFNDYGLVVCGHSLGAGCASLLAIMLRPAFPSIRCYAYCPPGGLLDEELGKKSEDFIISVVRHDDIIPRLSSHNFETVRDEFFTTLERVKIPKIQLFLHLRRSDQSVNNENIAVYNEEVLKVKSSINQETDFHKQLEAFRAERQRINREGANRVDLYIPGKIIHLVDVNGNGKYLPYWGGRRLFDQIALSGRMVSDHDIHGLVDILKTTANGWSDITFRHMSMKKHEDEPPPVDDIEMFVCCSNPYGILPVLLSALAVVSIALGVRSYNTCAFASIQGRIGDGDYVVTTLGLYRWGAVRCVDGLCETAAQCIAYQPHYVQGKQDLRTARIAGGLSQMFGFFSLVPLCVSMCFKVRRRLWVFVTCMSLLASFFIGLCLMFKRHCDSIVETRLDAEAGSIETRLDSEASQCNLEGGAVMAIVSGSMWFGIAVCSAWLAKKGRERKTRKNTATNNDD